MLGHTYHKLLRCIALVCKLQRVLTINITIDTHEYGTRLNISIGTDATWAYSVGFLELSLGQEDCLSFVAIDGWLLPCVEFVFWSSRILLLRVDWNVELRVTTVDSHSDWEIRSFFGNEMPEELIGVSLLSSLNGKLTLKIDVAILGWVRDHVAVSIICKPAPEGSLRVNCYVIDTFSLEVLICCCDVDGAWLWSPHVLLISCRCSIVNVEVHFAFKFLCLNSEWFLIALELLDLDLVVIMMSLVLHAACKWDTFTEHRNVLLRSLTFSFNLDH